MTEIVNGVAFALVFAFLSFVVFVILRAFWSSKTRADIPPDIRAKFERIGEWSLELALASGQHSETWSSEVGAILRDDQSRTYLIDWLREQR